MTRRIWHILLALLVLTLSACASRQYQPDTLNAVESDQPFSTAGRLAVKVDEKGHYGNFTWQHTLSRDDIEITTPVGSTVAKIERNNHNVRLIADGKETEADNAEELTENTLGYPLPLDNLRWWIRGKIAPDAPYGLAQDGSLLQQGWHIRFFRDGAEDQYPKRVELSRDNLSIKVVTHSWQ